MKVVLATPTLDRPYPAYLESLKNSVPAMEAAGIDHSTVFEVGCPYISHARSSMLRKAMDAKADAVVFIDHDVSWRAEDLVNLIQTPGEVISGTYRFKKDEEEYMTAIYTDADGIALTRADGCIKASRVPAGFLKITKEAVDIFMREYPELVYGLRYTPSVDLFNHGAYHGTWWGEDYAFARRWTEKCGDIWLVPDLNLDHHGKDKAYQGNFHNFLRRQPGGDLYRAS